MVNKPERRNNIGAFWLRKLKKRDGHYIKGFVELEGKKHELVLFINSFKKFSSQPDYVVREQIEEVSKYEKEINI